MSRQKRQEVYYVNHIPRNRPLIKLLRFSTFMFAGIENGESGMAYFDCFVIKRTCTWLSIVVSIFELNFYEHVFLDSMQTTPQNLPKVPSASEQNSVVCLAKKNLIVCSSLVDEIHSSVRVLLSHYSHCIYNYKTRPR